MRAVGVSCACEAVLLGVARLVRESAAFSRIFVCGGFSGDWGISGDSTLGSGVLGLNT